MDGRIVVQVPAGITRELVTGYLSRCRGGLPNLKAAVEHADFESARISGHRMKGSGGAYGIPKLTELGASIEQASKAQDGSALQNAIAELEEYLGRLAVDPE